QTDDVAGVRHAAKFLAIVRVPEVYRFFFAREESPTILGKTSARAHDTPHLQFFFQVVDSHPRHAAEKHERPIGSAKHVFHRRADAKRRDLLNLLPRFRVPGEDDASLSASGDSIAVRKECAAMSPALDAHQATT